MKGFLTIALGIIRFFILFKVVYLLYKTSVDEINYPLGSMTWWIYYLIFDIWVMSTFKTQEDVDKD